MSSVTETFVGTAGTELTTFDADWTEHTSYTTGSMILTDANRVRAASSTTTCYWHSWTPSSPNYRVAIDWYCKTAVTGWIAYVCGRVNTAANTMYIALAWPGNGYRLYRVINGTFTQIGSQSSKTYSADTNYNLILEMEDSGADTIVRLYAEGDTTSKITYTDTTPITAAGKAALRTVVGATISDTTGWHATTFSAEDLGGGATTSNGEPGTFTITGAAATGLYNRIATADPGSFAITGAAATGLYGRVSTAEPGTFTITGVAAEGVYTPAGAYTSIASPGSFAITGVAATGVYVQLNHYTSNGAPGAFTITGSNATVSRTYIVTASPGSFTITGVAATGVYGSNDIVYSASSFSPIAKARTRDNILKIKTRTPAKRIKI